MNGNSERCHGRGFGFLLLVVWFVAGCTQKSNVEKSEGGYSPAAFRFKDDAESNARSDVKTLKALMLTSVSGKQVAVSDLLGSKHLVLVFTRGYYGDICVYCSTQTSRLIANYDQFRKRNTEVVVVFPVKTQNDQERWKDLVKLAKGSSDADEKVPFPLMLDLELKAVDNLGIREQLSKPATYILDKDGRVQFAYVGNTFTDRPSVALMLKQLDKLQK